MTRATPFRPGAAMAAPALAGLPPHATSADLYAALVKLSGWHLDRAEGSPRDSRKHADIRHRAYNQGAAYALRRAADLLAQCAPLAAREAAAEGRGDLTAGPEHDPAPGTAQDLDAATLRQEECPRA